ncbi:sensor histidine kinase [Kribbella sp. NPDC004536]|uniref:sensor histidine kinase n=1 Tax=Kribbella sp. NPDC004536 TaxID=3364106 RepID=UPI0036935210
MDARWRYVRVHPLVYDVVLAFAILMLNGILLSHRQNRQSLTVSGTSLIIAGALFMLLRRRFPVLALALTTAVGVTYTITQQAKSPIGLFMACAAYTLVQRTERRTRAVAIVAVMAVTVVAAAVYTDGELFANLVNGLLVLCGAAIGEAAQYRRAYLQELEERAVHAEQSREEEAERRVMEERMRIAHELHDVIAHHIALMNVQSGVAAHVLRSQPDQAEEALALVRSGGRTVLQELTVLLGVLRRSGTPMPTAPAPSLQQLDTLVSTFTAAGVDVHWTPPPSLGPLPDVVELTAYRVIQESLTNVLKHAPTATAHLTITRTPTTLTLTITNSAPTTPAGLPGATQLRSGHGLVGMRERVAAVGGVLQAGPDAAGGFAVRAVLPLETGVVGDDQGVAGRRPDVDPERVPGADRLGAGPAGGG